MISDNQRQEPREPRDESVHIQVQHAPIAVAPNNNQPALVLHANTRDISASGFNASSNMALQPGQLLDVVIELRGAGQPFLLTAEVRWCQPHSDGGYAAGFVLLDAAGTDLTAWRAWCQKTP